jgi:hypothetical protein
MREAPASSAFSISSLTADAGRSTTSPAAMRSMTVLERRRTRGIGGGVYRRASSASRSRHHRGSERFPLATTRGASGSRSRQLGERAVPARDNTYREIAGDSSTRRRDHDEKVDTGIGGALRARVDRGGARAERAPTTTPTGCPATRTTSSIKRRPIRSTSTTASSRSGRARAELPGRTEAAGPAALTYNSRVWEYGHPGSQDPLFTYTPIAGDPALGLGWTLTLGAIKTCPEPCFVGPDGSRHVFDYAVNSTDYKTSDASPFYLRRLPGASGWRMWDGDGNRYEFSWQVDGFDDDPLHFTRDFGRGRDGWYATSVTDPSGNSYAVDYFDSAADGFSFPCWGYLDGRCAATGHMVCAPAGATRSWIVKRVRLPAAPRSRCTWTRRAASRRSTFPWSSPASLPPPRGR